MANSNKISLECEREIPKRVLVIEIELNEYKKERSKKIPKHDHF